MSPITRPSMLACLRPWSVTGLILALSLRSNASSWSAFVRQVWDWGSASSHRFLDWLKPGQKLVLDGDALIPLLTRYPHPVPSGSTYCITPHQAEWQRLSDLAYWGPDSPSQSSCSKTIWLQPSTHRNQALNFIWRMVPDSRHTGYGDWRNGRHFGENAAFLAQFLMTLI